MTAYYIVLAAALGACFDRWVIPLIVKLLMWGEDDDPEPDYAASPIERMQAMMHLPDPAPVHNQITRVPRQGGGRHVDLGRNRSV